MKQSYEESSPISNPFSHAVSASTLVLPDPEPKSKSAFTAANTTDLALLNNSKSTISPNNNNNSINNSRQKFKPEPLVIPSAISSFQQQNPNFAGFYANPLSLMHSQSMLEFYNSQKLLSNIYANMIYPNTTFLKSPRLVNYELKLQYTPPPMLSPLRKGPGLFCNSKQFSSFFHIPPQQLSHSVSCMTASSAMNLYNQHMANNNNNNSLVDDLVNNQTNKSDTTTVQQAMNENNSVVCDAMSDGIPETPSRLVINTSKKVKDEFETFFPVQTDPEVSSNPLSAGLLSAGVNSKP